MVFNWYKYYLSQIERCEHKIQILNSIYWFNKNEWKEKEIIVNEIQLTDEYFTYKKL